jgi:iron complex transport system substrate-binding protein
MCEEVEVEMKKRIKLVSLALGLILISMLFLMCTQSPPSQTSHPTSLQSLQGIQSRDEILSHFNLTEILNVEPIDDTGYRIQAGNPQRIVSLAPSNTEILFAIGAGGSVVGLTDYCNYPPVVLEKKKSGEVVSVGGYSTINVEKVISLKPDLVVAVYGNGIETIETLRKFDIDVIAFDPKTLKDVMEDIILIGIATGHQSEAEKIVERMLEKIKSVREKVGDKPKVRIAHILWHDPVWVSGKNTFIDEVITIANGENVFEFDGWRVVSLEDIISANPDVILVSSGSGMGGNKDVVYEWVLSDERLKSVKAVKEGRVYVIDADIISRPSYRLADAVEIVAGIVSESTG